MIKKNKINQRGHEISAAFFGRTSTTRRGKSLDADKQGELWKRGQKNPMALGDLQKYFNNRRKK